MREVRRVGLKQGLMWDNQEELDALFSERAAGLAGRLDRMEASAIAVLFAAGLPTELGRFAIAPGGSWRELAEGEPYAEAERSAWHPALAAPQYKLTIEETAAMLLDALRWLRPWLKKNAETRRAALWGMDVGLFAKELSLRQAWERKAIRGIPHESGSPRGGQVRAESFASQREERTQVFLQVRAEHPDKQQKWIEDEVRRRAPQLFVGKTSAHSHWTRYGMTAAKR